MQCALLSLLADRMSCKQRMQRHVLVQAMSSLEFARAEGAQHVMRRAQHVMRESFAVTVSGTEIPTRGATSASGFMSSGLIRKHAEGAL
eukprot:2647459-Amphidinium_carterae.1